MKSFRTLLLILAWTPFFSSGQTIQNLQIVPANPTTADTVRVIADLAFTSGGCDLVGQQVSINGSLIDITAKHCVGMLTVICYTTDTFSLGLLPSGTYQLQFDLQTGSYDFSGNCTGFQSSPTQTLAFSVSSTNATPFLTSQSTTLAYDRQRSALILAGNFKNAKLSIIDLTGRILFNGNTTPGDLIIHSVPSEGIIIYHLNLPDGTVKYGRIVLD